MLATSRQLRPDLSVPDARHPAGWGSLWIFLADDHRHHQNATHDLGHRVGLKVCWADQVHVVCVGVLG